jgi:prepilin peptidase CpaA
MQVLQIIFCVCVVAFTAAAAVCDWRVRKLPNVLTVPALGVGLVFSAVRGGVDSGWAGVGHGLLMSLAGFAVGFGILWLLWMMGAGGGGDVKLMGALGAWLGPSLTFQVLVVSTLFAGAAAATMLAVEFVRLGFGGTRRRYLSAPGDPKRRKKKGQTFEEAQQQQKVRRRLVPFGVPVALATWSVLAYYGVFRVSLLTIS